MNLSLNEKLKILKSLRIYLNCFFSIETALNKIAQKYKKESEIHQALITSSIQISRGIPISVSLVQINLLSSVEGELIKSGEMSGNLSSAVKSIEASLHLKKEINSAIFQAFLYPIIIGVLTSGLLTFLLFYIFPQIIPIFKSFHQTLPLITKLMIGVVLFLTKFWIYIVIAAVLTSVLFFIFRKISINIVKKVNYFLLLNLPYIKNIYLKIELASWSNHISMMLKNNIYPEVVFYFASIISNHPILVNTSKKILEQIKFGKNIDMAFMNSTKEMEDLGNLVCHGQETGTLAEIFESASEEIKLEALLSLKKSTLVLEPLLLVFMGLIIGCVAYSMIAPIYGLTAHIQ